MKVKAKSGKIMEVIMTYKCTAFSVIEVGRLRFHPIPTQLSTIIAICIVYVFLVEGVTALFEVH